MVPEIRSKTDRIFCHFGVLSALLLRANDPEDQNFVTMKKKPGDIIILYMCMINEDHMIDGS